MRLDAVSSTNYSSAIDWHPDVQSKSVVEVPLLMAAMGWLAALRCCGKGRGKEEGKGESAEGKSGDAGHRTGGGHPSTQTPQALQTAQRGACGGQASLSVAGKCTWGSRHAQNADRGGSTSRGCCCSRQGGGNERGCSTLAVVSTGLVRAHASVEHGARTSLARSAPALAQTEQASTAYQ